MKGRVLVLDHLDGREIAALMVDGHLEDLALDPAGDEPLPGAIYRAVADRPMKGQGGIFVSLPGGVSGFLRQVSGISPGQRLLVQVTGPAEPGKALPVTTRLLFKSRFAIVTPGAPGLNISRRIRDEAARDALAQAARPGKLAALPGAPSSVAGAMTMEKVTDYQDASSYNNFYEFGTDKDDPARQAHTLRTNPWSVQVEGLVKKPGQYALEDLLKLAPQEQRTYRLRCVEGWSMVIPWVGYSLAELIRRVEPQGSAKFVEFVTLADPKQMPGLRSRVLDWPYVEALRLDEAMYPLTLLAFGMYGEVLPNI